MRTGWTPEFFQGIKGCSATVRVKTGERTIDVQGIIDTLREDAILVAGPEGFAVAPRGLGRVQINSGNGVITGMAFAKVLDERTALLIFSGPLERVQRRSAFRVDLGRPGLMYVLSVPVGSTLIQGPFACEVLDISVGGCKVRCTSPVSDGAIVRLSFTADLGAFELVGQVRGAGEGVLGVQWLELPAQAADRMRKQVLMQLGRYTPSDEELGAAVEAARAGSSGDAATKAAGARAVLGELLQGMADAEVPSGQRQAALAKVGQAMGLLQELATYIAAALALEQTEE